MTTTLFRHRGFLQPGRLAVKKPLKVSVPKEQGTGGLNRSVTENQVEVGNVTTHLFS